MHMENAQKLMPIGDLFKKTWAHFKKDFKKLYYFLFLITIPSVIQVLVLSPDNSDFDAVGMVFALISGILGLIGATGALQLIKNSELSVADAFKNGMSLFWQALLISIVSGIIAGLGFILLIIPGIIASIYLTFVLYGLALDNTRGMDALRTSKNLVSGYWWGVFGRYTLLGIAGFIIVIIPIMVIQFGAMHFATNDQMIVAGVLSVLVILISIAGQVFGNIYGYYIYENLKQLPHPTPTMNTTPLMSQDSSAMNAEADMKMENNNDSSNS